MQNGNLIQLKSLQLHFIKGEIIHMQNVTFTYDLLTDLYNYVKPSDNLMTFMHGEGNTSGYNGTWYSNTTYRIKFMMGLDHLHLMQVKNTLFTNLNIMKNGCHSLIL